MGQPSNSNPQTEEPEILEDLKALLDRTNHLV